MKERKKDKTRQDKESLGGKEERSLGLQVGREKVTSIWNIFLSLCLCLSVFSRYSSLHSFIATFLLLIPVACGESSILP